MADSPPASRQVSRVAAVTFDDIADALRGLDEEDRHRPHGKRRLYFGRSGFEEPTGTPLCSRGPVHRELPPAQMNHLSGSTRPADCSLGRAIRLPGPGVAASNSTPGPTARHVDRRDWFGAPEDR